jgi:predicted short-subunit dehydrogenase-like oxidoreductase (DUF2520 family)
MTIIGLIGAGRLGTSLALALEGAGYPTSRVSSANPAAAEELAVRLGGGATSVSAEEIARDCELVFLTVPDSVVRELADSLPWRTGSDVVHCSGALGLGALDAAARAGGRRGCLHPLQAFPDRFADVARFEGIVCGVEADGALATLLGELARGFGAQVIRLEGVDRARYHAAAVFASNYLVALHAAAARSFALAGLPPEIARTALWPLTLGTAQRIAELPLERALTGPVSRGDTATVAQQLAALAVEPELRALYVQLGALLLQLPIALDGTRRDELTKLLDPRREKP